MHTKKLLVLLVSLLYMQLSAMEMGKNVNGVVVQYQPGYTVSKLFAQLPSQEQADHNQKMMAILQVLNNPNRETTGTSIINLSYFKCKEDLGIYYVHFVKPTPWNLVHALVQDLPGFEKLHDIEVFEKTELGHKDNLLSARMALLDEERQACIEQNKKQEEMRVRKQQDAQQRVAKLVVYKELSARQGFLKGSAELIATK